MLKRKKFIINFIPAAWLIIFGFCYFFYQYNTNTSRIILEEIKMDIHNNYKTGWLSLYTWIIKQIAISEVIKTPEEKNKIDKNGFLLWDKNCNFIYTGNFKFIDIATPQNRIYTPENTYQTTTTTKTISISWDIDKAYLCIVSDISDKKDSYKAYKKYMAYNTVTKIIFGSVRWAINVWYFLSSRQFYDYDTDSSKRTPQEVNGQFYTHETPFQYLLNLNSVILADEINGWRNYYPLINELKDWKTLKIGWYMTKIWRDDYWASSISYYRLIRKWNGEITMK